MGNINAHYGKTKKHPQYQKPDENQEQEVTLNTVEQKRAAAKRFIVRNGLAKRLIEDPDLKILVSGLPGRRYFTKGITEEASYRWKNHQCCHLQCSHNESRFAIHKQPKKTSIYQPLFMDTMCLSHFKSYCCCIPFRDFSVHFTDQKIAKEAGKERKLYPVLDQQWSKNYMVAIIC